MGSCCTKPPLLPPILEAGHAIDILKEAPEVSQPFKGNFYGKIHRVVDGDTIKISIVYGFSPLTLSLRLKGIDAPEIHSTNPLEKAAGLKVKQVVSTFLVSVGSYTIKLDGHDKFGGRVLGDVVLPKKQIYRTAVTVGGGAAAGSVSPTRRHDADEDTLTDVLKRLNVVEPYFGARKKPWTTERLKEILRISRNHLGEPQPEEAAADGGSVKIDCPGDGSVTVKYAPFYKAIKEIAPESIERKLPADEVADSGGRGDEAFPVLPPPLPERTVKKKVVFEPAKIDVDDASSGKGRRKRLEKKDKITPVKRIPRAKRRDDLRSDQTVPLDFCKTDIPS